MILNLIKHHLFLKEHASLSNHVNHINFGIIINATTVHMAARNVRLLIKLSNVYFASQA